MIFFCFFSSSSTFFAFEKSILFFFCKYCSIASPEKISFGCSTGFDVCELLSSFSSSSSSFDFFELFEIFDLLFFISEILFFSSFSFIILLDDVIFMLVSILLFSFFFDSFPCDEPNSSFTFSSKSSKKSFFFSFVKLKILLFK